MARKAEQGSLQYAVANIEPNPPRLGGAGFISGVLNDFLRNPRNPFNRLTPIGRWLGYFWDSKIAPLSLDFADGTNTLDPRITFSRSSNATVTDSNGNIVYAPHNLLTFSEQFDNAAWSKTSGTVTANAGVAPYGTTTADQVASTGAGIFRSSITVTQGVLHTASVYAKYVSGNTNFIFGFDSGPASGRTTFNLQNGTIVSNEANVASSSIVNIGNGWYRCVVSAITTSTSCILVYYNATSGANWLVWGAQLNVGSLQQYYPTTVKNLLGFTEQFDNAAWTKSNSFIQTNLLVQSESFDAANWAKSTVTVTANNVIAPNGSTTADKVEATAADSNIRQTATSISASTAYTFSVYLRADTATNLTLFMVDGGGGSGTTSQAVSVTTEWQRFTFSRTTSASTTQLICQIGGASSFSTGEVIYAWGAQLVQGSVAGDYVQTTSAALAVMYQAPNGTLTADKLVENTANANHFIDSQTISIVNGTRYTASIYVKEAGRGSSFEMYLVDSGIISASRTVFNLTTGTITSGSQASITPVGNGWYRCSIYGTVSSTSLFLRTLLSNATYTGDGTSGIYIWGAQLSDSASLDPYVNNPVAAPSAAAYYGPRFDYDPVTRQPRGLLIEEARTNLLLRSEEFDNASWTKARATISQNVEISPDGTQDADKLVEDTTASNTHLTRQVVTVSANTTYTYSVYLKASERTTAFIQSSDNATDTNGFFVTVNLSNGTLSGGNKKGSGTFTSSAISNVGNGWYRVSITGIVDTTTTSVRYEVFLSDGTSTAYTGNGTSGLFVWGAQLEAGSFPTSYIPTTTATVTRAADVAVIQGSNFSSWYNQDQGSIFAESQTLTTTGNAFAAQISDNSYNNRILVGQSSSSSVGQVIVSGSVTLETTSNPLRSSARIKQAFGFTTNSAQLATSGVLSVQDSSGAMVFGLTRLDLGSDHAGFNRLNGTISRINYYNRRLDNSQLQDITK